MATNVRAKVHKWRDVREAKLTTGQIRKLEEHADKETLAMNLRRLREELGLTQEQVAAAADISQSEMSRTEKRQDHRLSTLRRYAEAIGGELEIYVVVGDKKVKLSGA
jgi:DNA-binding XRE family transcriptional regulator